MTLEVWAWLALVAYTLHIMEEYTLDWRNWARDVLGLPVEWSDFYITNAAVIILGFTQTQLASSYPIVPLSFAALMLINAVVFHILPVIATKNRFSPGTITAVLLFFPVGIGMYRFAAAHGMLSRGVLLGSMLGGAVLMAYPIILLRLKGLPYFKQTP